jgi:hypothetical protein
LRKYIYAKREVHVLRGCDRVSDGVYRVTFICSPH